MCLIYAAVEHTIESTGNGRRRESNGRWNVRGWSGTVANTRSIFGCCCSFRFQGHTLHLSLLFISGTILFFFAILIFITISLIKQIIVLNYSGCIWKFFCPNNNQDGVTFMPSWTNRKLHHLLVKLLFDKSLFKEKFHILVNFILFIEQCPRIINWNSV